MGILTDPSLTQRNKFGRSLVKKNRKICFLFYVAGIVWFCCLSYQDFNHATYLSENALSPGLVYSEVKPETGRLAQSLLEELLREREFHKSSTPHSWISAKMKQIGLEVHSHNFTLNYPLGGGKKFHGRNIYGILRAPRIGSTEGIVYSAPYRPPNSVHTNIVASVPLLLAFADAARKKNYWAKDLIFLVTEQEQLGMHAWLQAYYKGGMEPLMSTILESGNLPARAGALQAALNLEIEDLDAEYINVKIEGLNGQLPNLDMFNLVQRIAVREGIISGYKQVGKKKKRGSHTSMQDNLNHMISMILTQASGIPTGNHGLFHRYRVESLTLEAVKRQTGSSGNRNMATMILVKTVEGISRSLNNLLEKFHQSFFFYILVQNDRFISIGDFMPCLILMAAPLLFKSFLLWSTIDDIDNVDEESKEKSEKSKPDLKYFTVLWMFGAALTLGYLTDTILTSQIIGNFFAAQNINTEFGISAVLIFVNIIGIVAPFFIKFDSTTLELLHIAALIILADILIVIGLLNFALGFLIAVLSSPLAIILNTKHDKCWRNLTAIYTFLLNPLVFIYLQVVALTIGAFRELPLADIPYKAFRASMDAVTFSLVDSMIYGNWLYFVAIMVFFPLWIIFWSLCVIKTQSTVLTEKLKVN